jgi:hypothetical protein
MKFSQTFLGKRCPPSLLTFGRLLLRPSQRRRFVCEIQIRREQDSLIAQQYNPEGGKVVVYIVDGADWITGREKLSGGLMAIASDYEEAKKLPELSDYQVIMVTLDSTPLILRHTEFENSITVFRLSQVFSFFRHLRHLIIHVPELLVPILPAELGRVGKKRLAAIPELHINIMNQNIQKMPGPEAVDAIRVFDADVTMTTAHSRYCTREMARRYRLSMHHLSNFCGPELYHRRPYGEKNNLLVASNDEHPMKAVILGELQAKFPDLRIQVIQNMTYSQAKAVNEQAKWGITFGEGMDLYFLEAVFSGGIGFAVYNDEFFPPDCKGLPTVFESYEQMRRDLPAMLERLNNLSDYNECHNAMFDLLQTHNRHDQYLQRLQSFYRGEYDIKFPDAG